MAKRSVRLVRYNPNDWIDVARRQSGLSSSELELEVGIHEEALRVFVQEQVQLIKSISADAYDRMANLILTPGKLTPEEIQREFADQPDINLNTATRIARTEASRTMSGLTEIQSRALGGTTYSWQTMRDIKVRKAHKHMQGVICSWDDPPELEDGTVGHAGRFPNCRCWPMPDLSNFGEGFVYKRKRRQLRAS